MKKSLVAVALASVALASAVNAKTVVYDKDGTSMYLDGRVMAVWYNTGASNSNAGDGDSTIINSGRFGIGASSPIGNTGINAIGYMQWDVSDGDKKGDNGFKSRDQYVGVDGGKWGKVIVGKYRDSLRYVTEVTDIYETWGQNATYVGEERRAGQIQYTWKGSGFTVEVGYQAAKDDTNTRFSDDFDYVESGGNIAVGYDVPGTNGVGDVFHGPLSIRAGFGYYAMQDPNEGGGKYGDEATEWAFSATWGNVSKGLYLSLMYNAVYLGYNERGENSGYDDTTYQGLEFVIGYGFENGIKVLTGYSWLKMDTDSTSGDLADYDGETAGVIPLFIDWQLNPKFDVWIEGLFAVDADGHSCDWASIGNIHDQQAVGVGARYNF